MGHFLSDLRDVEFDLFEVFRVQEGPAAPDADTDPDTLRDLLRELDRLATGPLSEGYADADRHPAVFAVAVWCTRIFTGRRLYTGSLPRFGRAPHPSQLTIVGPSTAQAGSSPSPPASNPPPTSARPPSRTPRRDT